LARQLQAQLHDVVRFFLELATRTGIFLTGKALSSVTWRDSSTTSVCGHAQQVSTKPAASSSAAQGLGLVFAVVHGAADFLALARTAGAVLAAVGQAHAARADGRRQDGFCDQGPALLVNHHQIVTRLNPGRIEHIAALIEAQVPPAQWPPEWSRVDDQIRLTDVKLGTQPAPGEALAAAIARGPQGMLDEIKRSKLRGRGGAGYATATKWQLCRNAPGQTRYVVCNADEGEPGTFKDRVLLTSYADLA
jgi:hypothetical protein